MRSLGANDVQSLVAKAFTLEAITEKPGCTTRYEDLPGKPLQDFVIAGINCSHYFGLLTNKLEKDKSAPIFEYNLSALKDSNRHKSSKYINFGLLEIMFPVVYARLKESDPAKVIRKVIDEIKSTTNRDVQYLLETRQLAWSTSTSPHKTGFDPSRYQKQTSVWELYMAVMADFADEGSNFQWTNQFNEGLPILTGFFDAYSRSGEIMSTTKQTFEIQKAKNPKLAVGILADMCAAGIFLWLSFNDHSVG